jgi:hypothetical protein
MKEEESNSEKERLKPNSIKKVGPMYVFGGGDIILQPNKAYPLKGFDKDEIHTKRKAFFESVAKRCEKWYAKFPECCDAHRRLKGLENFDKANYDFIPKQIEHSIAFLIHSLEVFIDSENWHTEITDYWEYLEMSLGSPRIGGHIFESMAKYVIENVDLTKEFDDDKRIELLTYFKPKKKPIDFEERDLELLYNSFQKWIDNMPSIGMFVNLKKKFEGKIPMNIFMQNYKANKYTGMVSAKMRSRKELLIHLQKFTNGICQAINKEITSGEQQNENSKNEMIIAAEEKMKIESKVLFDTTLTKEETNYCEVIKNWLEIVVDYYKTVNLNLIVGNSESVESKLTEIESQNKDVLSKLDFLKVELSNICSQELIRKAKIEGLPSGLNQILEYIEDKEIPSEEQKEIYAKLLESLKDSINKTTEPKLFDKLDRADLSVKHKLKLTIPLFVGLKYEGEIALGKTEKLPTNYKELKEMIFKKDSR